ncbi:hypothetical protein O181_007123 [Austropuccinia psidii MF-1]|uniref:Uncharacterized protein n=1 Tax=Austropuccinia psidii MF-1 TaxID=1389203 RepID=A0A9Q3GH91_9BASI|nr:hypothetical protein [Austropuccinia psidii MF-1]
MPANTPRLEGIRPMATRWFSFFWLAAGLRSKNKYPLSRWRLEARIKVPTPSAPLDSWLLVSSCFRALVLMSSVNRSICSQLPILRRNLFLFKNFKTLSWTRFEMFSDSSLRSSFVVMALILLQSQLAYAFDCSTTSDKPIASCLVGNTNSTKSSGGLRLRFALHINNTAKCTQKNNPQEVCCKKKKKPARHKPTLTEIQGDCVTPSGQPIPGSGGGGSLTNPAAHATVQNPANSTSNAFPQEGDKDKNKTIPLPTASEKDKNTTTPLPTASEKDKNTTTPLPTAREKDKSKKPTSKDNTTTEGP